MRLGDTHAEWREKNKQCEICGKVMANASLKGHMEQQHGVKRKRYEDQEIEEGGEHVLTSFKKGKRTNKILTGLLYLGYGDGRGSR